MSRCDINTVTAHLLLYTRANPPIYFSRLISLSRKVTLATFMRGYKKSSAYVRDIHRVNIRAHTHDRLPRFMKLILFRRAPYYIYISDRNAAYPPPPLLTHRRSFRLASEMYMGCYTRRRADGRLDGALRK